MTINSGEATGVPKKLKNKDRKAKLKYIKSASVGKNDRQGVATFFSRKSGVTGSVIRPDKNFKRIRKLINYKLKRGNYDE